MVRAEADIVAVNWSLELERAVAAMIRSIGSARILERAACAQVIGFIRSRLPAGSESAYTADELARFNKQRKSRSPFSPYDAPR